MIFISDSMVLIYISRKMMGKEARHIILDLDGTLVVGDGIDVFPRPYLEEFLDYCFATYETVSIWTAASPAWLEIARKRLFPDRKFFFMWTEKKCTRKANHTAIYNGDFYAWPVTRKLLKKVWKRYKHINRNNTLIIDDTPETYQDNYGNAIPILSYDGRDNDNILQRLIQWLPSLRDKSIRSTEKRCWMLSSE